MIKAAGRAGDGQPLVILGLSGENVARLFANEPIRINLAELGLRPCHVVIVGGQTEDAIAERLRTEGLLPPPPAETPPDPVARRYVLDHPAIATQRLTCRSVPEQWEGILHDGRVFYFRYRSGWARLGLGTGLDAAVFDAMEGPGAEDRAWEYETATGGAFDTDAEASKVFDALLDRHLREDRMGCPST